SRTTASRWRIGISGMRHYKLDHSWHAPVHCRSHSPFLIGLRDPAIGELQRWRAPFAGEIDCMSALDGLTVIDASRVLGGPYCGQILADHGARVIKIEPPQGDETRHWGPPFQGDAASYFIGLNRNKEGIALDFSQEAGRTFLLQLLEGADVFVENFKTGTLEKW